MDGMKSINLKIPIELHREYKKACQQTGIKMCYPIITEIRKVAHGYKDVVKRRRHVPIN